MNTLTLVVLTPQLVDRFYEMIKMDVLETQGTGSLPCILNRQATPGTFPSCSGTRHFTQNKITNEEFPFRMTVGI